MTQIGSCFNFLWSSCCLLGLAIQIQSCHCQQAPYIWPLPTFYNLTDAPSIILSNDFSITTECQSTLIANAIQRYNRIIFTHVPESAPTQSQFEPGSESPDSKAESESIVLQSINLIIGDPTDNNLNFGADESYFLSFSSNIANNVIRSDTVWGALRGLETFSQLIFFNFSASYYQSRYEVFNITDTPRFKWRGILLDTGRHFQPIASLKAFLNSLQFAKFNTFHWHITDTQSFPYQSQSVPYLSEGAYNAKSIYTLSDVRDLIEYGTQRGIRIVPEFDMPGHTMSWCVGYPEICPNPICNSPSKNSTADKPNGILNPAVNVTYTLVSNLMDEVMALFPDDYIHLGGDEVSTSCWDQTPAVVQWEQEMGFNDQAALLYFETWLQKYVYQHTPAGKKPGVGTKKGMNWVDVFDHFGPSLNTSLTTIQVWKSQETLIAVVEAGFNAILSSNVAWYLNYVGAQKGYNSWQKMYETEPFTNITDSAQQQLILGGEGCLWGEYCDASDVLNSMWPRAAAIAERLWSNREVNDTAAAEPRLAYFRCLLLQRGVAAEPYGYSEPGMPPKAPSSCFSPT